MVFLQPIFLYGLILLTIPILIHFLNFRKSKTVYFSSLRFIEEVKSTYRKRNHLTDLLLLLLRLLAIAGLIFAFAQPVIQKGQSGAAPSGNITGLFIDNSQSMELVGKNESLLAEARNRAKEMVSEFSPDSKFQLLYNGVAADMPGITDRELTLNLIDGIQQSASPWSMDKILQFFAQVKGADGTSFHSIILLSDFQESMFSRPLPEDSAHISVIPVALKPMVQDNISIDTCWLDNPITLSGQNNAVIARINNRSDQSYEDFPVRLVLNDSLRNETTIKLPARSIAEVSLNFHPNTRGWQTGSIQISDFPVTFDNELIFSFRIESDIRVLALQGPSENKFLTGVFGNDPYFRYESYGVAGFPRSDFSDYNLVVLSGISSFDSRLTAKLTEFMNQGGTVWFLPQLSGQLSSYNEFLQSIQVPELRNIISFRVDSRMGPGEQSWLQEVVVNVDKRLRLPYFNQSYRITSNTPERTDFLNSVSGDLLLSRYPVGKGSFVLSGFPLDEQVTDIMYHPLFIPLCYRIATLSKTNSAWYQIIGNNKPFSAAQVGNSQIRLKNRATGFESIPVQQAGSGSEAVLFPVNISAAGLYNAISGSDTVSVVAFNYPRTESDLKYLPDSVVKSRLKGAGWYIPLNNNSSLIDDPRGVVKEISSVKIWYYFLAMTLLALLAESFVMHKKK